MQNKTIITIMFLLGLLVLAQGVLASTPINPTGIDLISYTGNYTKNSTTQLQPTMMNDTRGYIHVVNFNHSEQSPRWKAYIGNISGQLALGDSNGNYLFNWNLTTVTGEIYATRYNGIGVTGTLGQGGPSTGGIVSWSTVACASRGVIENETFALNHNTTIDVDALNRTMLNVTQNPNYVFRNFRVADTSISTATCSGTFLNNGSVQYSRWQEVVLDDGTADSQVNDLMYAVQIENHQTGFNGATYDYQILLPTNAAEGSTTNDAYYFYIELVGDYS